MNRLDFKLEATASGSRARAARLTTRHNEVLTPTFMPVGTHAAVRSQRREDLLESGVQVLLANTYHLLLRPGIEIFEKFGGRYLVRSPKFEVPEGSSRSRQIVVEFPSYASALGCYHSPEYQVNKKIRDGHLDANFVIVEGIDGP